MMRAVVLATALLPSVAWADPCAMVADGMPTGPVDPTLRDGDLGFARRGCLRSEVALSAGGDLTIDTANFYGYVTGGLQVDGSAVLGDHVEVFARLEAFRLDLAIASLSRPSFGIGALTTGMSVAGVVKDDVALSGHASFMFPTAQGGYQGGVSPMGVDAGFNVTWRGAKVLLLHTGVVGFGDWSINGGPTDPRFGLTANLGIEVRPAKVFGLVIDVDAGMFYRDTLDHLSPGLGLRFSDGKRFGFELGGRVPLLGAEPSLMTFGLRTSVRLGPIAEAG